MFPELWPIIDKPPLMTIKRADQKTIWRIYNNCPKHRDAAMVPTHMPSLNDSQGACLPSGLPGNDPTVFWVEDLVKNNEPLAEWQIKSIHQLILKNIGILGILH